MIQAPGGINKLLNEDFCPGMYLSDLLRTKREGDLDMIIGQSMTDAVSLIGTEGSNDSMTPNKFLLFGKHTLGDIADRVKEVRAIVLAGDPADGVYSMVSSFVGEYSKLADQLRILEEEEKMVETLEATEDLVRRAEVCLKQAFELCIGPYIASQLHQAVERVVQMTSVAIPRPLTEYVYAILVKMSAIVASELHILLQGTQDASQPKSQKKAQKELWGAWMHLIKWDGLELKLTAFENIYKDMLTKFMGVSLNMPNDNLNFDLKAIKFVLYLREASQYFYSFILSNDIRDEACFVMLKDLLMAMDPTSVKGLLSVSKPTSFWYSYTSMVQIAERLLRVCRSQSSTRNKELYNMMNKYMAKWKTHLPVQVLHREAFKKLNDHNERCALILKDRLSSSKMPKYPMPCGTIRAPENINVLQGVEMVEKRFDKRLPLLNNSPGFLNPASYESLGDLGAMEWNTRINDENYNSELILAYAEYFKGSFGVYVPNIEIEGDEVVNQILIQNGEDKRIQDDYSGMLLFQGSYGFVLRNLCNVVNLLVHELGQTFLPLLTLERDSPMEETSIVLLTLVLLNDDVRNFQSRYLDVEGVYWRRNKETMELARVIQYDFESVVEPLSDLLQVMSHKVRIITSKISEKFQREIYDKSYSQAAIALRNCTSAMALLEYGDVPDIPIAAETLWVHELMAPFLSILNICQKERLRDTVKVVLSDFILKAMENSFASIFRYGEQLRSKHKLSLSGPIGQQHLIDLRWLKPVVLEILLPLGADEGSIFQLIDKEIEVIDGLLH